jgi:two-component system, response regulator PdtaR
MRVWLVDHHGADKAGSLGGLLRQLQERPDTGLQLIGACTLQPDFTAAMAKLLPDLLDLIVIHEAAWPSGADLQSVLNLGAGVLIATAPDRLERFRCLGEQFPVSFVRESPDLNELWLALLGACAGRRRHIQWRNQLTRLQQRLDDRIIIERAKGILVYRLKISEEEAYQRLRLQSRRQRRQIRDIAQSLLDTQSLMDPLPSENGAFSIDEEKEARQPDQASPPA